MKKVLLIICITALLLTGCKDDKPLYTIIEDWRYINNPKIKPAHVFQEGSNDDDSWKYDVAERLYNEFCHFYANIGDKLENDTYYREYKIDWNYKNTGTPRFYTDYNALMASDRAKGVIAYRDYLDKTKVDYIISKIDEVNQHITWFDWVYSGYTKSGLHFVSLPYNYTRNAYYCWPACDKIRGDLKESEFLTELFLAKEGIMGVDLYVEDLSQKRDEIEIYPKFRDCRSEKILDEEMFVYDYSFEEIDVLKRYNRQPVSKGETKLKNKSWNLYMVSEICDELMIEVDGVIIELKNHIPSKQSNGIVVLSR